MLNLNLSIHEVNPKLKFIVLIVISGCLFLFPNWIWLFLNLCTVIILSITSRISYKKVTKQIYSIAYFLLIVFFMHIMFYDWIEGLRIILRFIILLLYGLIIIYTTTTYDMISAIQSLMKPLSYIGINNIKVGLALSLAIRFIPLIVSVFQETRIAQKARGLENNLFAVFVPAIVRIMKLADDISSAIEARSPSSF